MPRKEATIKSVKSRGQYRSEFRRKSGIMKLACILVLGLVLAACNPLMVMTPKTETITFTVSAKDYTNIDGEDAIRVFNILLITTSPSLFGPYAQSTRIPKFASMRSTSTTDLKYSGVAA